MQSKPTPLPRVVGWLFVCIGLLSNEWILGALFCADGKITPILDRMVVWGFEIACIATGLLLVFKKNFKTVAFGLATVVGTVLLMEVTLHMAAAVSPKIDFLLAGKPVLTKDEVHVWRGDPRNPEHDENGFRNAAALSKADIIAMGDSVTYGAGVGLEEAWPQQIELLSGLKTYNMGFCGWGPIDSLIEMDRAIDLNPRLIIEEFSLANGVFMSFNRVYNSQQMPELKTSDPELLKKMDDEEKKEKLETKIKRLFAWSKVEAQQVSRLPGLWDHVRAWSKLYGLVSIVIEQRAKDVYGVNNWEKIKKMALENKAFCEVFEKNGFKTVFEPHFRLLGIDAQDPRIEEGYRISMEAIRRMDERAKAHHIDFIVLMIPTKELVFKDFVFSGSETPTEVYSKLVSTEEKLWDRSREFFRSHDIFYIDTLPKLREYLSVGIQPYPETPDGHPTAVGQRGFSEMVLSAMKQRELQ